MYFCLIFAHSPKDCPAVHKGKMDEFRRLLLPESLRERQITLLDGYVDKLCLAPEDKDHFSYFVFEAGREQKMTELEQSVRELFKPASVELRVVKRWGELASAAGD
jgi:hypothetical protein